MNTAFKDNTDKQRFELTVGSEIVFADYRLEPDGVLTLLYVEAPPSLRGSGAAGRLMQIIMDDALAKNRKVRPVCSYAAAWIARHDEFKNLVA